MNNVEASSSTAGNPPTPTGDDVFEPDTPAASEASNASERKKKLLEPLERKAKFLTELMYHLDLTIYTELVYLYYLDCSFPRFLLRTLSQLMFLTPHSRLLPRAPKHRPYIGAIFLPFIICLLLHLFSRLPTAAESTRGYLHGGIIFDFIGQRPAPTKLVLLGLDCLVAGLQCFMLAVFVEQEGNKEILDRPRLSADGNAVVAEGSVDDQVMGAVAQDQDAEERGIFRAEELATGGIEMQEMGESSRAGGGGREGDALLESGGNGVREFTSLMESPLEVYSTGNAIIVDVHVMHTLRTQWTAYDKSTHGTALQTVGGAAGYSIARVNAQFRRLENLR